MRQVTIYTTDESYRHFVELAQSLSYVKKIETDDVMKEAVVANIKAGLKEVKKFERGQLHTTPAKEFLNEL